MPVDATPYQNMHQQPNLLEQIMQVGRAANTLGDIEVGRGNQLAIRPDGTMDQNVLAQHLKQSVVGSMKAPAAMQALEALRQHGYSADEQGLRTLQAKTAYITSAIAPLVRVDDKGNPMPVTQKQVLGVAAGMLRDAEKYGIKVPEIMKAVTEMQGMDDAQRGKHLYGQVLQGQQAQRAFEAIIPRTSDFDVGTGTRRVITGSQVAPAQVDTTRDVTPGTPTVDDRRTIPGPGGAPIPNPNFGQPQIVGPGGTGSGRVNVRPSGSPDAPPPARDSYTNGATVVGREPTVDPRTGAVVSPRSHDAIRERGQRAAQNPTPAPAATATAPARLPTGLTPGTSTQLQQSAETYAKDVAESRDYQTRVTPLREAIPRLARLGTRGTGPGTQTYNDVKSFAQTWGLPIPNADALKDFAEAKKYLTQNAVALAPPGTNIPSVTAAFEANPNVEQPNAAALYLAKSMLTLARLKQASVSAFREAVQSGRAQPHEYTEWSAEWMSKQDPRAYGADLWSKADRTKLSKSMREGSPQAKRFRSSVDEARRLGLLGDVEYIEPR